MQTLDPNINKLKQSRDKLVEVFESEAKDDVYDNGNLSALTNSILLIEKVIKALETREQQP